MKNAKKRNYLNLLITIKNRDMNIKVWHVDYSSICIDFGSKKNKNKNINSLFI